MSIEVKIKEIIAEKLGLKDAEEINNEPDRPGSPLESEPALDQNRDDQGNRHVL